MTRGLSAVPRIPAEIRDSVRARLERDGVEALHAELALRDPVSAERLKLRDRTRIARALEVIEATGRALPDWHREGLPPLLPSGEFSALFLAPDATQLYARIDARFDVMLAAGALEEVAALAARQLDPLLPAMKAHGVPVLIRHLCGEITLERPPKSAAPTPATTPSGNSPGSGTSCRNSSGWRRRRRRVVERLRSRLEPPQSGSASAWPR